jgi:hypothetical protein
MILRFVLSLFFLLSDFILILLGVRKWNRKRLGDGNGTLDSNAQWFELDKKGFIQDPQPSLERKPAVYIYQ